MCQPGVVSVIEATDDLLLLICDGAVMLEHGFVLLPHCLGQTQVKNLESECGSYVSLGFGRLLSRFQPNMLDTTPKSSCNLLANPDRPKLSGKTITTQSKRRRLEFPQPL